MFLMIYSFQHPVGDLVLSACLTHHKRYGSCVTTLLTMAAWWGDAVQGLIDQVGTTSMFKNGGKALGRGMLTHHRLKNIN